MNENFTHVHFVPLDGLVSYSMQDGELRGSDKALRDLTYDGNRRGDRLTGGLGQLNDGETGHTNFRIDAQGGERGTNSWPFE